VTVHEIPPYRDPLDLLHRFTATPFRLEFSFDFANVSLKTNDVSLFPATTAPSSTSPELPRCLWKLVRDSDSHLQPEETSILIAGDVVTYSLGPACIMAADRGCREILAFIGTSIDIRTFRDAIYPMMLRLTEFIVGSTEFASPDVLRAARVGDVCNA
jgi:hypothetical protein